ncbi:MAG: bifunctional transaldolase/phosoglucose isomerase [Dehalococcoidia bacterium]|nr:bifunctional transaldolase/phosoglucose isomerase [Dehalococcoidia bacterium]
MPLATEQLIQHGQSVWLDYIRRGLLRSGEVDRMVADGWITGMTSNPTIFDKAISESGDYEEALQSIIRMGEADPYDAFVALASEDIQLAADALRPVYESTAAVDGYVSLEVPPGIEHDREATVAEALRLFRLVDRPNVMIKVPGTPAGVEALTELIAAGVNVNVTLLFSVAVYERVAEAYIAGLERRLDAGERLDSIAGVASFFVSRVDTAVDGLLPEDSPLRGQIAVANARHAYARFQDIFSGERWDRLAQAGARPQRPLWASTGTKNPAYSDTLYVETLIFPDTVNTLPQATLDAVLDHLVVEPAGPETLEEAGRLLGEAEAAGVDLTAVTDRLLVDGLASFEDSYKALMAKLDRRLSTAPGRQAAASRSLGDLAGAVEERLAALRHDEVVRRLWMRDHTVWKPDPAEISDRLGFLTAPEQSLEDAPDLTAFAREVAADGFTDVVLMGMGGSSLTGAVLHAALGTAPGALNLHTPDTTDPEELLALEASLELDRTLFIAASKSGTTIETSAQLAYFWEKAPDGARFAAITDEGTPLDALARERRFRRVFHGDPEIGGRYSALSVFGMAPAALIGADVGQLAMRAQEMLDACRRTVPSENPGALLGAVLGEAALAGRDKLTLVLPEEVRELGTWIEQIVAESLGKEGRGIVPVAGEPLAGPDAYGADRIFVALGDHDGLDALAAAGHPVVRLPYCDPAQLPAEFIRWEIATAVAGHVLGVHPFDQPNVQEAKDATARVLADPSPPPPTPSLADVVATLSPGDYLALLAYLPRTPEHAAKLQDLRLRLRDRHGVATTVGFGPRYLHSTGQLHKGGPPTGVLVQIVRDEPADAPVPGKPYTFGQLKAAQAQGDLEALLARGRRVARVTLEELASEVGS